MSQVITSRDIDSWASDPGVGPDDEFLGILSDTDTDDGVIVLLEINHETLEDPLLICSGPKVFLRFHPDTLEPVHGLVYGEREYVWCAFAFVLVKSPESGALGTAQITVENIDPILTVTLREIADAPDFTITILRKNDISKAQYEIDYLKLTDATMDYAQISGTLSDYDYLSEVLPQDVYTRAVFRGLS